MIFLHCDDVSQDPLTHGFHASAEASEGATRWGYRTSADHSDNTSKGTLIPRETRSINAAEELCFDSLWHTEP